MVCKSVQRIWEVSGPHWYPKIILPILIYSRHMCEELFEIYGKRKQEVKFNSISDGRVLCHTHTQRNKKKNKERLNILTDRYYKYY